MHADRRWSVGPRWRGPPTHRCAPLRRFPLVDPRGPWFDLNPLLGWRNDCRANELELDVIHRGAQFRYWNRVHVRLPRAGAVVVLWPGRGDGAVGNWVGGDGEVDWGWGGLCGRATSGRKSFVVEVDYWERLKCKMPDVDKVIDVLVDDGIVSSKI
jgi:hypothetical protein